MTTYPTHITEKAQRMIDAGSKMTFEAICEMFAKSEAKSAKKATSSKRLQNGSKGQGLKIPQKTHFGDPVASIAHSQNTRDLAWAKNGINHPQGCDCNARIN